MRQFCRGRLAVSAVAFVAFVAVMASAGMTTSVQAQEALAGELDRLGQIVSDGEASALGAAHQMGRYRVYLPAEDYAARLGALAEEAEHSLVEYVLRRHRAWALLEAGQGQGFGGNEGFAASQGCLVDWQLVGPFENSSMQGFYEQLGPERGEQGPYAGRLVEVDWRELSRGHFLCSYSLNARVHPSTSAVVYLAAQVDVEEAAKAVLLVGSRSAYRLWVNGEAVGERSGQLGLGLDAEGWPVELKAGRNEVLVKLASSGEGGLGWTARLVDEEGRALEGVAVRGAVPRGEVEAFAEEISEAPQGALAQVREAVKTTESVRTRLWAAYLWSRLHGEDGSAPWRDVAESLEVGAEALSAEKLQVLSELYEEHWKRQQLLDLAVEQEGAGLMVRWARAEERGEGMSVLEWEAQRRELEALIEEAPGFLLPVLSLAMWFEQHEGWSRPWRVLNQYEGGKRESVPAWVRMAADLEWRVGEEELARGLRRRAAELNRLSGSFGWRLAREAVAKGEMGEALELVRAYREQAPWTRSWGAQEVMLLRAGGHYAEALEVLDRMIEEAPGDAELRERRAELAVVADDVESAMASMEEAMALRPQANHLREYLEYLQPEADRFYEPWVVTDLRELGQETEEGPFTYDFLVDQKIHQVESNGLAREFVQRAHRVIRDDGIDGARAIRIGYQSGDERVEVLDVRVLKPDGTVGEDYRRQSSGSSRKRSTTYNDRVYLTLRANHVEVGDIVEFRYVVHQVANENFRGDYFGDVSYVQRARPVAFSRYGVIYPDDWELHFREPTLEHQRIEDRLPGGQVVGEGQRVTSFELRDVPRVYTDENQPGHTDVYDHILVSNKANYDEVGRWWWNLIEEQLVVDDAIRETVAGLVQGREGEAAKVEAIYDFVARNTRYLHLGLGIHGWKPYRTSTVLRNRYGDCKDKAALLKVMLEEAGVEAQMVLVRTRHLGKVEEEPASMHVFNHAVTYVPSLDLFLDATAEFNGPYELTSMDQGAQALVIHDGGQTQWVTMPIDEPGENLLRQELEIDLRGDVAQVQGRLEAHGANAVSYRRTLEDAERRDERFERRLASTFAGVQLLEAEYENLDDLLAPTRIYFRAEVPGILRGGDDGRSLYPMATPRDVLGAYARESSRHQDRMFRVPFANEVHLRYRLPDAWGVERMPESANIESPFGSLRVDYRREGAELVVDVHYSIAVQQVSVADYSAFRSFVAEMHGALNETIQLIGEEVSR